jgi:hypothetical protein
VLENMLKVINHIIIGCRGITHNKVDRLQFFRVNPVGWGFFLLYLCTRIIKLYANMWVAIGFLQKGDRV